MPVALAEGLDIKLNTAVRQVRYTASGKPSLQLTSGCCGKLNMSVRHALPLAKA